MQSKLTLRMEKQLIEEAKVYSQQTGKSLSRLVADYFRSLSGSGKRGEIEYPPNVKALIGAIDADRAGREEYREYLEEKYL